MRQIEAAADKDGTSYATMMDRAGAATAFRAIQVLNTLEDPRVTVLAGKGNNGGDGLVAARYIAQNSDADVRVYLPEPREDALTKTAEEAGVLLANAEDDRDNRVLRHMVGSAHVLLDALYGIGARVPLDDAASRLLGRVRVALTEAPPSPEQGMLLQPTMAAAPYEWQKPYIIAVDCPSGLDCDTGEVDNATLEADETITYIAAKHGLFNYPGAAYVGELFVADLGIRPDQPELKNETHVLAESESIRAMLPQRPTDGHKGTFGRPFIVAGSTNYVGAAGLAALAAYRAGSGLVSVGTPMPVVAALASQMLEPTWVMLPHDMGVIGTAAVELIQQQYAKVDAMLIGPGLGQEETTGEMLGKLFEAAEAAAAPKKKRAIGFTAVAADADTSEDDDAAASMPPLVLDADALNLLAKVDNWWEMLPENTIITPHPGEMARLVGLEGTGEVQSQRLKLTTEKATAWNVIVLLKGAHTLVAAPDGRVAILPVKTSALAKAGTGDVLAGIIVSLLAQGAAPYDAAVAGAYIHGLAGLNAADFVGSDRSLLASDVIDVMGEVLGELTATR